MILNDEIFNSKGNTSYVFISPIYFALLRFSKKKKDICHFPIRVIISIDSKILRNVSI